MSITQEPSEELNDEQLENVSGGSGPGDETPQAQQRGLINACCDGQHFTGGCCTGQHLKEVLISG